MCIILLTLLHHCTSLPRRVPHSTGMPSINRHSTCSRWPSPRLQSWYFPNLCLPRHPLPCKPMLYTAVRIGAALEQDGHIMHTLVDPSHLQWELQCYPAGVSGCGLGIKQLWNYLLGRKFTLLTNHATLQWLLGQKMEGLGLLARWALVMQEYNFHSPLLHLSLWLPSFHALEANKKLIPFSMYNYCTIHSTTHSYMPSLPFASLGSPPRCWASA